MGKLIVQAVKVHRIPYATFFVVILVDQKGKGATHSEQVGSESMNQLTQKWSLFHYQGSKSKHHIAELNQVNQPSHKWGWSGL